MTGADLLGQTQAGSGSFTNADGSVTTYSIGPDQYEVSTSTAENQPISSYSLNGDGTFDLLSYTFNADGSRSISHVHGGADGSAQSTVTQDYDSSGAIISQQNTNSDGSTDLTTYTHSSDGSYSTTDVHNPAGGGPSTTVTQTFGPDADGNPILSQTSLNDDGSTDDATWAYENDGSYTITNVHTPSDNSGVSSLAQTYNAAGQLVTEIAQNSDGSSDDRTWTYGADGSRSGTDVYTPYGGGPGSTLTQNYDSQGALVSQHAINTDGSLDDVTFTYGANDTSTVTDVHTPAASGDSAYTRVQNYDANGLVSQLTTHADSSTDSGTWTRNSDGSLITVDVFTPAGGGAPTTTTQHFDPGNNLVAQEQVNPDGSSQDTTYTYGTDGSTSYTTVWTTADGAITTQTNNFDANDRIVSAHTVQPDGSVSDDSYSYNSDGTSTLTNVQTASGNTDITTTVTQYDAGGQVLAQNSYDLEASGSYTDQWSAQDGSHGSYWWSSSTAEYQDSWYNSDGSSWQDDYQYASGGSPGESGHSFTETYAASDGSTGTRQFDAATGTTSLTWDSAATGAISGTTADSGFVGLQHDDLLTNTQQDLTFFNPAVSSSFDSFLTAHS